MRLLRVVSKQRAMIIYARDAVLEDRHLTCGAADERRTLANYDGAVVGSLCRIE